MRRGHCKAPRIGQSLHVPLVAARLPLPSNRPDVAVLGAGITGLTAAHQLLKAGCRVSVFDSAPVAGGLAGSFESGGFAFDFGPHEFCTDNQVLIDLLEDVCGDDLLVVQKRAAQLFRGRFVRYPFRPMDVLHTLGFWTTTRAATEILWQRVKRLFREPDTSSFERWTRSRFGSTLYEQYFGPYTRKVWGIDPDDLDHVTASNRIAVDSLRSLIKKTVKYHLFGLEDFDGQHGEFQHSFRYTRGGIGTLQTRMRQRVEELGGTLHFGRRLVGVERDGHRVVGLRFDDGSSFDQFGSVVSTIPLPIMLRAVLGAEAEALLRDNSLPFRGLIFVFLRVSQPKVSDYHWIYFPDADTPFQRFTEFSHFGAGMSPEGTTGLTIEVASDPGDGNWELTDAEVTELCVARLVSLGLLERSAVLGADVVRVRHGYPKQVKGFQERTDVLLETLARNASNLASIGRQGLFRYCNMNECMEMAIDVAPRVAEGEMGARFTRDGTWKGVTLSS